MGRAPNLLDRTNHLWKTPGIHVPLSLDRLVEFPVLKGCVEGWRRLSAGGLPATIDPAAMPVEAIKGISLIVREDQAGDWVVRLSSTLMDQGYGRSMTGCVLSEAFGEQEYPGVRERLEKILASGVPDLARREFIGTRNRRWAYVRLVLPLSSDGVKRDRYAVIYDPGTFGQRLGD